ncbi:MAG: hypothetical protein ACTSUE_00845 [Promethearchaeota archaeon]
MIDLKDARSEIIFKNTQDGSGLKNAYLVGIHPLAHSKTGGKTSVLYVPAWLESPQNLMKRKLTFLELMKH